MTNRAGCGNPLGSTFKRIDYAWSKNILPVAMERFGMVPPGDGAPSDHYGIIIVPGARSRNAAGHDVAHRIDHIARRGRLDERRRQRGRVSLGQ